MIRSRAGRVIPRTHSVVTREGELELDVSQMDSQINDALKQSIRTAEDAVQRIVAFDDANDVLNAKAPVVELSVEFHHLTQVIAPLADFWYLTRMCHAASKAPSPIPHSHGKKFGGCSLIINWSLYVPTCMPV